MPLDLFRNRARRPIKRPRNRPNAPAIKQSQLNGRAINNRQPASRNCHPTTLNYPATRGVFAPKLESAVPLLDHQIPDTISVRHLERTNDDL